MALRISANCAALLTDLGQVDRAVEILTEIRSEASRRGLALPEVMALGTFGSLMASGAGIHDVLGPLGPISRAAVLREIHDNVVVSLGLDSATMRMETYHTGAASNELAKLAADFGADDLSAQYFRQAIDLARALNATPWLANRLTGLLSVLGDAGHREEVGKIVDELTNLLRSPAPPHPYLIAAHRGLAEHMAQSDRSKTIAHLRAACDVSEKLRLAVPPGPARADIDLQFSNLPYRLAGFLHQERDDIAAFEALQRAKGRRVVETLAARAGDKGALALPPTLPEVSRLLDLCGDGEQPTVLVDLATVSDGIVAYVVDGATVRGVHVTGDTATLAAAQDGDVAEREARLVSLCLNDPLLRALAEAVCDAVPAGTRALVVPDRYSLKNLPLHAIPVQGQFWGDRMPISYIPAVAALRFATSAPRKARALVAGDSSTDRPLPGAAAECKAIATTLGVEALLGKSCTRAAIEHALQQERPDIVHLALHGRCDTLHGLRSSVMLADGHGGHEWVGFDSLTRFPWTARFVVFSGCSTGVLGFRHRHNLLSVANAALEAGVTSVLASLWPMDDEYASLFMIAFYEALIQAGAAGTADLRVVLGEARASLRTQLGLSSKQGPTRRRDGRDFLSETEEESNRAKLEPEVADALVWSPFALYGMPILAGCWKKVEKPYG